jgi:hypothetical protein
MTVPDGLLRTTYHEAGHSCMACIPRSPFGSSDRPSPRPDPRQGLPRRAQIPGRQIGKLGLPMPLLPAAMRRPVETRAMVLLAGELIERLAPTEPKSRYIPTYPDEECAERIAQLATPTVQEVRRFEAGIEDLEPTNSALLS